MQVQIFITVYININYNNTLCVLALFRQRLLKKIIFIMYRNVSFLLVAHIMTIF